MALLVLLFAGMAIFRLFFIQLVNGKEFALLANKQYVRPSKIFSRGTIFFKEKNGTSISAASLKAEYIIALNNVLLSNPQEVYEKISTIITVNKDDFSEKAAKEHDPYEVILKTIDKNQADKIMALEIPGLIVQKNNIRFYPAGTLASHVLGIVGQSVEDGDTISGRYGLERSYNDILSRDEDSLYVNFFAEIFSNIKNSVLGHNQKIKGDIVLTIEPVVEDFLEKTLLSIDDKWQADSIGALIIEPKTGRIIAMTSRPNFDPGNFSNQTDLSIFVNPIVESVFEMGSIVKPITLAAGIDSGSIVATTTYEDKGFLILNKAKISNFDGKARGKVNMQRVIDESLNTGAVFIMQKTGKELFSSYMKAFGLGDVTGVDLPNEVRGLVGNLDSKYEVDYATAAFGQGVALTPISVVRALSALANGGYLMKPIIVDSINYNDGLTEKFEPQIQGRAIRKETSQEVSRMLVSAFDNALLGGTLKIDNYSVAAKTGTAQIPKAGGGYYEDRNLHSFFGYFPAYEPRYLVFIYMINPKDARFAAETLAKPFKEVTKFLINYYDIPPDREQIKTR